MQDNKENVILNIVEIYIRKRYKYFRILKWLKWKKKTLKGNDNIIRKNGLYSVVENVFELAEIIYESKKNYFDAVFALSEIINELGWVYPVGSKWKKYIQDVKSMLKMS